MAELRKEVVVGLISIMEDKRMQVREDTIVYEGLAELSRTYTRYVTNPGDDVSGKPQIVRDLAGFLWLPEVIAAWKEKEKILNQSPPISGVQ